MKLKAKIQWTDLHHKTLKLIKKYNFENSTFLVACSGGLDSLAGFYLLKELQMNVELCHIHHGGKNKDRDLAMKFVKRLAKNERIKLHVFKSSTELTRENEMREFRINIWRSFVKTHIVTLSHQKDDLLETRMMRLIRGTGPEGLLAMTAYQGFVFRPFLSVSKQELRNFLTLRKKEWVEDPSNHDQHYFRNFIRQSWLRALEKQKPGSLTRLAESLENLIQGSQIFKNSMITISRVQYLLLSEKEQIQALALLLKNNGCNQFSLSQLKEIQRRLDKEQKHHTFKCAGVHWVVNAQQISLDK